MTFLDVPNLSCRYQPTGQAWLISMHCSHKTFHFLSVSDSPTSILSDVVMTLRKSHEIIFVWCIFEKLKILARDDFETSQRRHGKDIFFETYLWRLKDITKKNTFFEMFLGGLWDISLNGDLIEISQRHLIPAGNKYTRGCLFRNKCEYRISNTWVPYLVKK